MPTTAFGRWAIWLALAFVVMFAINAAVLMQLGADVVPLGHILLPAYGIGMFAIGLISSILTIVALVKRDRSWFLWVMLLPGAFVIFFLIGEFLIPPFD